MKTLILTVIALSILTALGCQNTNGQDTKRKLSKPAAEWKKVLTSNQYHIMVESGTEPPYQNEYWNNHEKGVYVSAATGDTLFTSDDKFDSGTGWPSFVKPVDSEKVAIITDNSYGMSRDEVIEKSTGLHLGHVFNDGPANRGGKRYCMNSGALKFIKKP
ncbi:peptide-methionine (R)-S-oxide reductase MsrB [Mucilaginibacter sp. P25]|uniref:peptide-methionine (R)-S-oxide reductase n=1 Tax=Mucilaginibacter gossypii TaxID=551996 RepID=A0A1G7NTA7_9SPHI|nr:peptide-methionine (R)-S-oxide reductase MsrB [Mucilaginibacter gossypii]SDF77348.1 peptide-methionine (R)-S-oxide reductase/peptide methionine sulfoxide reductase msrA/msrB [Mucilaginibacter gossypii]